MTDSLFVGGMVVSIAVSRLIALCVVGTTAVSCWSESAGWQIETEQYKDKDGKLKSASIATVKSRKPIMQQGEAVTAMLRVYCHLQSNEQVASLSFSRRVALYNSPVTIRWEIGFKSAVAEQHMYDGRHFFLSEKELDMNTVAELARGETLVMDAFLPWAGRTLIEFDIRGASSALSKLNCRAP